MKFIAVCSFGVGSSLILKLSLDKAITKLGIDAEAENIDISGARGVPCDAIFTSPEVAEELSQSSSVPVFPVRRFMDVNEVTAAVEQYLSTRD